VDCPATTSLFTVVDPDLTTLFVTQPGFPSFPFLVVRLKHDCPFVAVFLGVALIVDLTCVSGLFSTSRITKIASLVVLIASGIFTWDFVQAFNKWQCMSEF